MEKQQHTNEHGTKTCIHCGIGNALIYFFSQPVHMRDGLTFTVHDNEAYQCTMCLLDWIEPDQIQRNYVKFKEAWLKAKNKRDGTVHD